MRSLIPLATTTPALRNLLSRSFLWCGLLLTPIAWLALSAETRAVTPAPDGGYPNGNTAEGDNALLSLTLGSSNTAVGFDALANDASGSSNTATGCFALIGNTFGDSNTATGARALENNATGNYNTANGADSLETNTTGGSNTATGFEALYSNTTGNSNTAIGSAALVRNTTGNFNTAIGFDALFFNTSGTQNTATGSSALHNNTIGFSDTANGVDALFSNTTGVQNTATGVEALFNNTTGGSNTANGFDALLHNTTGINNTGNGVNALEVNTIGHDNVADGFQALLNNKGSNNIGLGSNAGANLTTGSNNIEIGANVLGLAGEANTIRIGKQGTQKATFIAGIAGVTVTGSTVVVNASGKLGISATSSARFKEAVKPMDKASETILQLKPVTFRYKEEIDPEGIPQFGLVAEEVEKVNPSLITRDEDGKPTTVRYEAVNAMLLNEFLKEHGKVEEQEQRLQKQEATIVRQQKDFESKFAYQQKQIEALSATVQRVTDRLELNRPALQVVANDQ